MQTKRNNQHKHAVKYALYVRRITKLSELETCCLSRQQRHPAVHGIRRPARYFESYTQNNTNYILDVFFYFFFYFIQFLTSNPNIHTYILYLECHAHLPTSNSCISAIFYNTHLSTYPYFNSFCSTNVLNFGSYSSDIVAIWVYKQYQILIQLPTDSRNSLNSFWLIFIQ